MKTLAILTRAIFAIPHVLIPALVNAQIPTEAAQAGFTVNTFSTGVGTPNPFSPATVDIHYTRANGYQWYLFNLNSAPVNPASPKIGSDISFPGDGSIVLSGNAYGSEIATAVAYGANQSTNGYENFSGTAFGGSGYYIEMIYKQPPPSAFLCPSSSPACSTGGWPVTLSYTLEGSVIFAKRSCSLPGFSSNAPCVGWPGTGATYGRDFNHQLEADWFENHFGEIAPALHESFGIYNATCRPQYCQQNTSMPPHSVSTLDFTRYHKYGVLWIAATATTGGSMSFYIDDVQQPGNVKWSQQFQNTGLAPFIPSNLPNFCNGVEGSTSCAPPSWTFGVHDILHHVPVMGTGVLTSGASSVMQVQTVNVWQANASGNVTGGTVNGVYTQTASNSMSQINGTFARNQVDLQSGSLYGTGQINAPVINLGATVQGGASGSAGTLMINGSLTNGAGSTLQELITGSGAASYLYVNGNVSLNGTLDIATNGFNFAAGEVFNVLGAAKPISGRFAAIDEGSNVGNGSVVNIGNGLAIDAVYSKKGVQLDVVGANGSGANSNVVGASTDGPIPLWALGALGAGLVGIASRSLARR